MNTKAIHYTTIELGDDEYDVRVEADVLDAGVPEHYSRDPDKYDPGSGAELGPPSYTVEFSYLRPHAHDVTLPGQTVARYWSPEQRAWHLHELQADAEAG